MSKGRTSREILLARTKITNTCWLWYGFVHPAGYGYVYWNGKMWRVHRLSYETFVEEIPKGLVVDHLCRVKHCINPKHLEVCTLETNTKRGFAYYRKTKKHCKNGHKWTLKNTYYRPSRPKYRECLKCRRTATNNWMGAS